LLDEALWRRFDEVLSFELPTIYEIKRLMRLRLKGVSHEGVDIDDYASSMKGFPHAATEKLVIDARRNAILRNSRVLQSIDLDVARPGITSRPW
jgi:SpoVK/Ycf46/Vps4 family AAA+-type ATPase